MLSKQKNTSGNGVFAIVPIVFGSISVDMTDSVERSLYDVSTAVD